MILYGVAVLSGLIAITIIDVKIYKHVQPKLVRYEKYIPKIRADTLAVLVITIVFW